MRSAAASYTKQLRSIKHISTLFYVAGYSPEEQDAALAPVRSPYLDTTYSNIRPRILADFPPDFVADLARIDRIKTRLASIYAWSDDPKMQKKSHRIWGCGAANMVLFDAIADRALMMPYACNSRFCPTCNRRRSVTLHERCVDQLRRIPGLDSGRANILWLTLTIRNPPYGELEPAIADLLFSFRELRKGESHRIKSLWSKRVRGYFWNFEITQNLRAHSWHPHIHVLMDSAFMKQSTLDATYSALLSRRGRVGKVMIGAAYTTDLNGKRYKPGPKGWDASAIGAAVSEIAKYQVKPIESERITSDQLLELTRALHNKRLFGSGGTWTLPAVEHLSRAYCDPIGLARLLDTVENPLAELMDSDSSVARAHDRACVDPVLAAGLARAYNDSATAQYLNRELVEDPDSE